MPLIFLASLKISPSPEQNSSLKQQTSNEHKRTYVPQNTLLSKLWRTFQSPSSSPPAPVVDEPDDSQHLETPEIYIILQGPEQSTRSKRHQSLEHDLHRRCSNVDKTITHGKIKASQGKQVNRVYSSELKLVGFPKNNGDIVVILRCGTAEFYSVSKITKYTNKKFPVPNTASINAVFCNVLYFPCYLDVRTIKMTFIQENIIKLSGNIWSNFNIPTLK